MKHVTTGVARTYGAASLVVVSATLLMTLVNPPLDRANIGLFYLLVVVIIATATGFGPGVCAALLSFVVFNYVFIEPRYTLHVADTQSVFQLIAFLSVAMIAGAVAAYARHQAQRAQRHASETTALYHLSQAISAEVDLARILPIIATMTCRILDIPHCAVILTDDLGNPHEQAVVGTNDGLPYRTIPIRDEAHVRGSLQVTPHPSRQNLSDHEMRLLDAIATQAYLAIDRARLAERAAHTQALIESDRLKSALLSSVSHDLRTPLAVIKGASSALLVNDVAWDATTHRSFVETIESQTDRLNRLVGNWLHIARIQAGALPIERDWQDPAELIGSAIQQCRGYFPDRAIRLSVESGLPLVWANAALIDLVLVNLLENAHKYGPVGTSTSVSATSSQNYQHCVVITVQDCGSGIPDEDISRVFALFYRGSTPESTTGSGLGLAICKGIIEAHNGQIWACNRSGGGAAISFTLPTRHP